MKPVVTLALLLSCFWFHSNGVERNPSYIQKKEDPKTKIVNATNCERVGSPTSYYVCELKAKNTSDKTIIATIEWTGSDNTAKEAREIIKDLTIYGNSTTGVQRYWHFHSGLPRISMRVLEARYKD